MFDESTSRREFLAASAAALASLWITADPRDLNASLRHAAHASHEAKARRFVGFEAFSTEEIADIEAMAEQILPSDGTPGAREAHVINFIDHAFANWAAPQKPAFLKGLGALNAEAERRWPGSGRFAQLSSEHQVELLKDWDKEPKNGNGETQSGAGRRSAPASEAPDTLKANTPEARAEQEQKDRKAFFDSVRSATLTGMFSNPSYGGNTDKIGWQLIGFDDRFVWQPPFGSYDAELMKGGSR